MPSDLSLPPELWFAVLEWCLADIPLQLNFKHPELEKGGPTRPYGCSREPRKHGACSSISNLISVCRLFRDGVYGQSVQRRIWRFTLASVENLQVLHFDTVRRLQANPHNTIELRIDRENNLEFETTGTIKQIPAQDANPYITNLTNSCSMLITSEMDKKIETLFEGQAWIWANDSREVVKDIWNGGFLKEIFGGVKLWLHVVDGKPSKRCFELWPRYGASRSGWLAWRAELAKGN